MEFPFQPAVWVGMIQDMQHYGGTRGVGERPLLPLVTERFVFGFGASRPRTAQLPRGPGCCPSCTGLHDFCRQSSGATEVRGCLGPASMVPFWHYHVQSRGTHGPSAQCRHLYSGTLFISGICLAKLEFAPQSFRPGLLSLVPPGRRR